MCVSPVGKKPCSWNSCMTSALLWSSVRLSDEYGTLSNSSSDKMSSLSGAGRQQQELLGDLRHQHQDALVRAKMHYLAGDYNILKVFMHKRYVKKIWALVSRLPFLCFMRETQGNVAQLFIWHTGPVCFCDFIPIKRLQND